MNYTFLTSILTGVTAAMSFDLISDVACLALSPEFDDDGIAFACSAADGRLWCTVDRGRSWEPAGSPGEPGLAGRCVTAVAVSPSFGEDAVVVAATADGAVSRSDTGGARWERVGRLPRGPVATLFLSPSFALDGQILAACAAGIFVTGDAGATWRQWGPS